MTHIRPGEGRKVLLTFLYFFLIITAYYVVKPASRSLVLGGLGSRLVPYVDLICAILMGPIVTLFARLVDRLPKPQLVTWSFAAVIGILVVFWKLLEWPTPWVAGALYVWVAIFSVLVVTLFWLVANDLYHPREAKRLFGFIGSGGILGGIVGSSIAAVGAQVIGTQHLLLLSAGLLFLSWLIVQRLWGYAADRAATSTPHETFLSDVRGFSSLILRSRYLILLVALVAINKLVGTFIYYQFNPFIEQTFQSQDAKTTFTGMFFGSVNIVAFFIQFFFTSVVLRRLGLRSALLVLPCGELVGISALLLGPVFWLAAGMEMYDAAMNYSLQQTTKEVLYLPIDRTVRYKVKPFIDMVVFRFGKGIAAIVGIVLLDWLRLSPMILSVLALPLIVVWIVIALELRREYVMTIRTMLQSRAMSAAASAAPPETFQAGEAFETFADGSRSAQKLALIDELVMAHDLPALQVRELLKELHSYETHLAHPEEVDGAFSRLKAIIASPYESRARRRRAIRLLTRSVNQLTIDYLIGLVMVESDTALRQEAVRALVTLRTRNRRLEFATHLIRRQMAQEVATYQRIAQVAAVYRQHHVEPMADHDAVMGLLRVLMEESVEQIFQLLMLLYRPEDIQLIYEQFRAPDLYVRADAIELLDNLVDPAMRTTLLPILDEEQFLSKLGEDVGGVDEPTVAYRVLQEAIWDCNYWLSVTTLCAVGRLGITTMRQELEKASCHHIPLVAVAAKVALRLATLS